MLSLLILLAAAVLAVWAALADAGVIDAGAAFQLLCLAVACIAASGVIAALEARRA